MAERVIFVDENDQPVGAGDRKEAWEKGYYTRNIRIIIRDEDGRILSQKRNINKHPYAGMWTVAAGGHVDEGESWDTAAIREIKEEIGVSPTLEFVGDFIFKGDESDRKIRQVIHVYQGTIDSTTRFELQKDEVEEVRWFNLVDLKASMKETTDTFTPTFKEAITRFY